MNLPRGLLSYPDEMSAAPSFVSPEEYLRLERVALEKHELRDGQVVAMSSMLVAAALYRACSNHQVRVSSTRRRCESARRTARTPIQMAPLPATPISKTTSLTCWSTPCDLRDPVREHRGTTGVTSFAATRGSKACGLRAPRDRSPSGRSVFRGCSKLFEPALFRRISRRGRNTERRLGASPATCVRSGLSSGLKNCRKPYA